MKEITREGAKKLLSGMAIIHGAEELILNSMGFKISQPKLKLKNLTNHSTDRYTSYTVETVVEAETENYLVAAGPVMGRYYGGSGVGKWKCLYLEFAPKSNQQRLISLELANLPVTTSSSTYFNSRNCSIIGAKIKVLSKDLINASYPDPHGKMMEQFEVDLQEEYQERNR